MWLIRESNAVTFRKKEKKSRAKCVEKARGTSRFRGDFPPVKTGWRSGTETRQGNALDWNLEAHVFRNEDEASTKQAHGRTRRPGEGRRESSSQHTTRCPINSRKYTATSKSSKKCRAASCTKKKRYPRVIHRGEVPCSCAPSTPIQRQLSFPFLDRNTAALHVSAHAAARWVPAQLNPVPSGGCLRAGRGDEGVSERLTRTRISSDPLSPRAVFTLLSQYPLAAPPRRRPARRPGGGSPHLLGLGSTAGSTVRLSNYWETSSPRRPLLELGSPQPAVERDRSCQLASVIPG
jgi:hypothetical protein